MVAFGLHYFEIGVFTQHPMDEIDMMTCDLGTFHLCTLGGSRLPLALLSARGNGASSFFLGNGHSTVGKEEAGLQHAILGFENLIIQQRHPGERYTNTWGARGAASEGSKEGSKGRSYGGSTGSSKGGGQGGSKGGSKGGGKRGSKGGSKVRRIGGGKG